MFNQFGAIMNSTIDLTVSVIVPVLNEKKYIKEFIESVLRQDFDKNFMEVLLIDGISKDGTRDIIKNYCKKYDFIKILDNIKKDIPNALNIGVKNAQGKYIIRMDAHTYYYPDYISNCIEKIQTGNYQNVGGPTAVGYKNRMQKIIAEAHYSPFALGGGKNHNINYEGLADTVQFGTFEKEYLLKMGLYDENIKFAEDDDLNFKIIENGGKIFITPKIKFIYYPRDNLISLFIQYFKYGMWKIAVIKKHKKPARISHLVPICFVIFLVFFPIISIFSKHVYFFTLGVLFLYIFLDLIFSFKKNSLYNFFDKLILFFTHFIIHISYGIGNIYGIFKFFKKSFSNEQNFQKHEFSKPELEKLQKKNLELIINFKKFCQKSNLNFFLCGGGCIGAIRHHGFIPWDDDLDVFMLREDYEKLAKIESDENFYILRTNEKIFTGQSFTLVSDKNSTLIKKEQIGIKTPRGVSIDVFPLDGCPDSKIKQKLQMIYACLFLLFTTRVVPKNHGIIPKIFSKILLSIIPSDRLKFKIARFCEKQMSKYKIKDCKYVKEFCAGPKYMKNLYKKEIFESCVLKKFENTELPVPVGYDEYLKTAFGNYMQLPPENERINSHDIIFLDLNNPCEKYKNQF